LSANRKERLAANGIVLKKFCESKHGNKILRLLEFATNHSLVVYFNERKNENRDEIKKRRMHAPPL